jgi:hypothetical protein
LIFSGFPSFAARTLVVTGALEGLLFGACLVGAMVIARRGGLRPAGMTAPPSPYAGDEQRT